MIKFFAFNIVVALFLSSCAHSDHKHHMTSESQASDAQHCKVNKGSCDKKKQSCKVKKECCKAKSDKNSEKKECCKVNKEKPEDIKP